MVENAAVRQPDGERPDVERREGAVHRLEDLEVGGGSVDADDVEVALGELPIATALRVFAAKDLRYVIAFEGKVELGSMGVHEAGEETLA